MEVYSNSEIGLLKKVIVHRPDDGISRISPKRAEELLFDDIVHLPRMQYEHDVFTRLLKHIVGEENVLEVEQLLEEALAVDKEVTNQFIKDVVDFEELPLSFVEDIVELDVKDQVSTLITGKMADEDRILFDPIPNFIFTRDIAVTIKDHVLITKANKSARQRENLLTRFIFKNHPYFKALIEEDRIINLNDLEIFPPSDKGETVSIEGGDIMMFSNKFLFVGTSERTTKYSVDLLSKELFRRGVVDYVAQIIIPDNRSFMHIDTVFTQLSEDEFVCFKPLIFDGEGAHVVLKSKDGSSGKFSSFKEFVHTVISQDIDFIFVGDGKSPYQEREQWTDGSNLLAVKSGVLFGYDRNPYTNEAFQKAGYTVRNGEELLKELDEGTIKPEEIEQTIINLPSNELSRARGGSHCMSCPIIREKV